MVYTLELNMYLTSVLQAVNCMLLDVYDRHQPAGWVATTTRLESSRTCVLQ